MSGDTAGRARGGALVALVVLALALGVGWWRAEAPAVTAGSGQSASEPRRVGDAPRSRAVDPGARAVILDPRTGGVIVRLDGDASPGTNRHGGLPRLSGTLWEAQLVVRPGQPPQRREFTPAGAHTHLLQYRCLGPGRLLMVTLRSDRTQSRRAACDGRPGAMWLRRAAGPIQVELTAAPGGLPVVADVRFAGLWF
ncbi:hypothetical protein [Micromonospora okii]|uniref:hypothetical protein n=1 Tax=Micromonospora okii TaxID=1182970 RepID=UPI001E4BDFEA|nr:hypothetical protein [Micromonospora okii]